MQSSAGSCSVISAATCLVKPKPGVLSILQTKEKKESDLQQRQQRDAVNKIISDMQTISNNVEERTKKEEAQLIEDARVVSHQIEEKRGAQHVLIEQHKTQQLQAVYTEFMQWVDQMTAREPNESDESGSPESKEEDED